MKYVIYILVYCAECMFLQHAFAQKNDSDSLYTYRSASPGGTGKFYSGREIGRVIGLSSVAWLDRGRRRRQEDTRDAIDRIQLPANAVIADRGAGTGY